jgi:hypothetical protein
MPVPKPNKYEITISPDGPYHHGDALTVTTDAPDDLYAMIEMLGYEPDGDLVISADHAEYPGGSQYGTPFYLGPSQSYTEGPLNVTFSVIHIKNGRIVRDASVMIHVES